MRLQRATPGRRRISVLVRHVCRFRLTCWSRGRRHAFIKGPIVHSGKPEAGRGLTTQAAEAVHACSLASLQKTGATDSDDSFRAGLRTRNCPRGTAAERYSGPIRTRTRTNPLALFGTGRPREPEAREGSNLLCRLRRSTPSPRSRLPRRLSGTLYTTLVKREAAISAIRTRRIP